MEPPPSRYPTYPSLSDRPDNNWNWNSSSTAAATTTSSDWTPPSMPSGQANFSSQQQGVRDQHAPNYFYSQPQQFISTYAPQQMSPDEQQQQQVPAAFGMLNPGDMLSNPAVQNMAIDVGRNAMQQGMRDAGRLVGADRLKQFFLVDNGYVGRKLLLLFCPLLGRRRWADGFDLYIPLMALLTYVLVGAFALGTQGRFSPEQLSLLASSAVFWLAVENVLLLAAGYLLAPQSQLGGWQRLALTGYKFAPMCLCLLAALLFGRATYLATLAYCSLMVCLFFGRSANAFFQLENAGPKRKVYLVVLLALSQPLFIYGLTSSLAVSIALPAAVFSPPVAPAPAPSPDLSPKPLTE